MPSPLIDKYKENKVANNHAMLTGTPNTSPYNQLYAGNYQFRAQERVMQVLNGYNPFGNGPMPNFTYRIPGGPNMGSTLTFNFSGSEVAYNGNNYTTLSSEDRKVVYFWLSNFEREGMLQYDKNYGI